MHLYSACNSRSTYALDYDDDDEIYILVGLIIMMQLFSVYGFFTCFVVM